MIRARPAAMMAAGLALSAWAVARAQTVDLERPATFVVGAPPGGARLDRVDAARSGFVRAPLPSGRLRTAWHASLGITLERAPVVDDQGLTYVVGNRGEAIALGLQGEERWRVPTSSTQPSPLALTSDRSLVFVDAGGEAIAVRDGAIRWRRRVGRGGPTRAAPLPLDDGGIIVATSHELAALDRDGRERSRVVLPEPAATPLVAHRGKAVVVGADGAIWSWAPGEPEAERIGTFGAPVDGAALLVGPDSLMAVTAGESRVAVADLARGTTETRAVTSSGAWLGPPAAHGGLAFLVLWTPSGDLAVALDEEGKELGRALLSLRTLTPDAGVDSGAATGAGLTSSAAAVPHTAPLVDAAGRVAFATPDGSLGVVTGLASRGVGSPVVELVVDACPPTLPTLSVSGHGSAPVAGLAPLAPGAFVAACGSGTVLAVHDATHDLVRPHAAAVVVPSVSAAATLAAATGPSRSRSSDAVDPLDDAP